MIMNPYCFQMHTENDQLLFDFDLWFSKGSWNGLGMFDLEGGAAPKLAKPFSIVLPYDYEKVIVPLANIFFVHNEDQHGITFKVCAKVASTNEVISDDLILWFVTSKLNFSNGIVDTFTIEIHTREENMSQRGFLHTDYVKGVIHFNLGDVTTFREIQEAILTKKSKKLPLGYMHYDVGQNDTLKKIFNGDVVITYKD